MRKFGLVLDQDDIDYFVREGVDLLLLPPGFSQSASNVQVSCGVAAYSLNSLIVAGEIALLSQRIAPFVRAMMAALKDTPIEAESSQNDLYQYHLRYQYLFLIALERFLVDKTDYLLVLAVSPYRRYISPMRPELGLLYENKKLLVMLAIALVSKLGGQTATPDAGAISSLWDGVRLWLRKIFFTVFMTFKLLTKSWHARRRETPVPVSPTGGKNTIGFIVRTDSEVIAASHLINLLRASGRPFVVIHDEVLSSTTTLSRLAKLGIESVSIGAVYGLVGVWRAWLHAPSAPLVFNHTAMPTPSNTSADAVLFGDLDVRTQLIERLFDFAIAQGHFSYELRALAERYHISCLVTFAYVDQWGTVIRHVGDSLGIKTVAVQNAAQDPEEYPRLCWADHYCVESLYLKERLVRLGYPSAHLSATGLPQFSALSSTLIFDPIKSAGYKRILLLTQPLYGAHYERLIVATAQLCAANGFELAIKFHPRQSCNDYQRAIAEARNIAQVVLFQEESLDLLIQTASIVVSVVSAALIRAVNLGTPSISFLPLEERHLDLYYANDSTLFCVPDIVAYQSLITKALRDYISFYNEALRKRAHYLDNHATFEPTEDSVSNIISVIDMVSVAWVDSR